MTNKVSWFGLSLQLLLFTSLKTIHEVHNGNYIVILPYTLRNTLKTMVSNQLTQSQTSN